MVGSANLNVMIQAARKASRRLLRDFGEVENLQVSVKGVGDFVSNADRKAEETIREMLTEARPNYGWLGEESDPVEGKDPGEEIVITNTKYWMGPDITVATASKGRVRAFGRVWDFGGRSAEICQIDWKGPR